MKKADLARSATRYQLHLAGVRGGLGWQRVRRGERVWYVDDLAWKRKMWAGQMSQRVRRCFASLERRADLRQFHRHEM